MVTSRLDGQGRTIEVVTSRLDHVDVQGRTIEVVTSGLLIRGEPLRKKLGQYNILQRHTSYNNFKTKICFEIYI